MSKPDDSQLPYSLLQFYSTSSYVCSYLPDLQARSQVATPTHLINTEVYSRLVRIGFRRSGIFTYRPNCDNCQACVPVRLPVNSFAPNRTQRKLWKRWFQEGRLSTRERPLEFNPDHYALYQRYQTERHKGGSMDADDHEQYENFLLQSRIDTHLIEFHETPTGGDDSLLRMVSIIDILDDGLSSVYTFYDTSPTQASYGTCNILWQIAQAQSMELPYVYLGYWIANSPKMSYKTNFQPIEGFQNGTWSLIEN